MMQQYLPITQKYRPQRFSELVGQMQVVTTLKAAFEQNSIAPAYLFTGPHGVGKTSAARIFAKLINCLSPQENEPCCVCENCVEILEGNSLDVIEIDAASNRRIDEVRQLRENIKFAPVKCKYKVYIIDEVHMLTLEAFNALLKTLEEPPLYVKFILATTHPNKLPPTVLSRCCRLDFSSPSALDMRNYISYICQKESIEIDEDLINLVIKRAEGSMRDAASLLEQVVVIVKSGEFSSDEIVRLLGGGSVTQITIELIQAVLKEDISSIVKLIDKVVRGGEDVGCLLDEMEKFLRAVLLAVKGVDKSLWQIEEDYLCLVEKFVSKMGEFGVFYCLQVIIKMKEWLKTSILDRLALELGFIKMALALKFRQLWNNVSVAGSEKMASVDGELKRVEPISSYSRKKYETKSVDSEDAVKNETKEKTLVSSGGQKVIESIPNFWREIQRILFSEKKMLLGHLLQDVRYVNLKDDILEVVFNHRLSYESIREPKNAKMLMEVVRRVINKPVKFKFGVIGKKDKIEKKDILSDRAKEVLEVFDGKVIRRGIRRQ